MKSVLIGLIGLFMAASAVAAEPGQVTPLMTKDLKEIAGKEAVLITVDYAPGASDSGPSTQCPCFRVRAGRFGGDAGEGRKTGDAWARTDFLRVTGRYSRGWS